MRTTDPKSINTGNFSSGDREEFLRLQKLQPGIVWYLLGTNTQLRVAEAECDFMEGKSCRRQIDPYYCEAAALLDPNA